MNLLGQLEGLNLDFPYRKPDTKESPHTHKHLERCEQLRPAAVRNVAARLWLTRLAAPL